MNIVQKIIKKFNDLPQDKKDHVYLGVLIGYPLVLLFGLWGAIVGIVLVALKEIVHDKLQGKGNPEFLDFVASALPIIFFILLKVLN